MSIYSNHINPPTELPVPVCPKDGIRRADEFKQEGVWYEADGYGPFPAYVCLTCGGEVDWE
jgi:hypothetical protein